MSDIEIASHGPHALALVLTVQQRLALLEFVRFGGAGVSRYRDEDVAHAERDLTWYRVVSVGRMIQLAREAK